MALSKKNVIALEVQNFLCLLSFVWFLPFVFFLIFILNWLRCPQSKEIQRVVTEFLESPETGPVLICSNHLTLIDSLLLACFLFPLSSLFGKYRYYPWNVPEITNFGKNPFVKFFCYLGKCVYVERKGSSASRNLTKEKLKYLLMRKRYVCIFPEGGRSRSGRVDIENAVYGAGELVHNTPDCTVLNVYMRGEKQKTWSAIPKVGDSIYMDIHIFKPTSESKGKRAAKEISLEIVNDLIRMEKKYFELRE